MLYDIWDPQFFCKKIFFGVYSGPRVGLNFDNKDFHLKSLKECFKYFNMFFNLTFRIGVVFKKM